MTALPIVERWLSVSEVHVANPEAYVEMLSGLNRTEDGQLYRVARSLRDSTNSAKASAVIENDEAWTCVAVLFFDLRSHTRTYWRKQVHTHLLPYLRNTLLPRWNAVALDETGYGSPLETGLWRLRSILGWRMEHHHVFMPPPGVYVCINPNGAPRSVNSCSASVQSSSQGIS